MARMPNMDVFDAYFRRADLDQDGRISGGEAVAFFQGANLPKQILAQIWMHADQNHTGFLGRSEFYNALKLVTVAQSGRELTPDIVRAALFGPAASQIPAPKIVTPAVAPPSVVQSAGFRGPAIQSSVGPGQPYASPANNQYVRSISPHVISTPAPTPLQGPSMGLSGVSAASQRPPISSVSTEWPGSRIAASTSLGPISSAATAQGFQIRGNTSLPLKQDGFGQASSAPQEKLIPSVPSKIPQDNAISGFQAGRNDGKGPAVGGNGFSSDSIFGGDVFSATPVNTKQTVVSQPLYSVNNVSSSTALVPTSAAPAANSVKQNQADKPHSTSIVPAFIDRHGPGVGAAASGPGGNGQLPWPRMTQSDVQRYTRVFAEVDTDRDGKITGEQARDLFLSWRLPREVLKQVWDLSDQDGDSMLSLREFCAALYLMERYREGRPLPSVLPSGSQFDEAIQPVAEVQTATQRPAGFNGVPWQHNPGLQQRTISVIRPGLQSTVPVNMQVQPQAPQSDSLSEGQSMQQKSRVPVLEMNLVNQLSRDEQNTLKSKQKDAEEAEKKVQELEKDIMDSKEKIDYYRSKLQELVLYKSRCDNRLNEITERAAADKREVESLSKKYEEKFKQAGESSSRLATEEAAFRDLQERKLELYNAIVRIEQGGNADSLLQVRADRIQADLEELRKAIHERCKHLGLRTKATALIELPYGWQPGIQENAADWDDDWDKFEDEGFSAVQDLSNEGAALNIAAKTSSALTWNENSTHEEGFDFASSTNMDRKEENLSSTGHPHTGSGASYAHSEDGSIKSGLGSPRSRSGAGSPPQEISPPVFGKNSLGDDSASMKEIQSNDHVTVSSNSGDAFGDGSWGAAFTEGNDDNESFWGYDKSAVGTKSSSDISGSTIHADGGRERHLDNPLFGSGDSLQLRSLRISSPTRATDTEEGVNENYDTFGPLRTREKSLFSFSDNNSVPGTPLFSTGSPARLSNAGSMDDHSSHFDSFAKFDSFNTRDSGLFASRDSFARFDSISSSKDAGHSRGFTSFDDTDPFASAGPFSLGGQTPRHTSDGWSAF
eukprot:Gb_27596 [translate_table: standard]